MRAVVCQTARRYVMPDNSAYSLVGHRGPTIAELLERVRRSRNSIDQASIDQASIDQVTPGSGDAHTQLPSDALRVRGFPFWMPDDMAIEWQSETFPIKLTRKAIAQWESLMQSSICFAIVAGLTNVAGRLSDHMKHDKKLINAYHDKEIPKKP